jgi:membrane-associated phospholipid phosphatase
MARRSTGHLMREIAVLAKVQKAIGRPSTVKAARGLSHFGEHSAGWFAVGLVGAAVDKIAVKRVVRRPRPEDPSVRVLVDTPSKLSFPSSHATSTTAAAVLYSGLTGRNLVPALVPPMLASRLVLGVHYPTDVLAGAALGGLVGGLIRRKLKRR